VSPALQPAYRFGVNQRARLATTLAETAQRQATIDRARAVGSLGDMPLALLTSTKLTSFYRDPLPADLPPRLVELIQRTARGAAVDMARLSTNSTIAPVEQSGHFIQFDRPDAVIRAVQTTVEEMRGRP
jgi:pimeloyl-ACP methyl ester carboxylesterase